jgi:phospholipid-transporting ATPase
MNDDDFARLVGTANPASQRAGYPPPAMDPFRSARDPAPAMDPFFDDDDLPDSAFGMQGHAMQSTESGLPFAQAGAPLAGASVPTLHDDDAKVKTWTFDDDEPSLPYTGASSFPGAAPATTRATTVAPTRPPKARRQWRWPWAKEEVLTGERTIALNDSQQNIEFCSNYISTSKYNLASFVPKFLFGPFASLSLLARRTKLKL